jgi:hypothetical protein
VPFQLLGIKKRMQMKDNNKQKDVMRSNFDEILKKIGVMNAPKSILDSNGSFPSNFIANGVKYKVMSPQDVFNIDKQTIYYSIKMAFDLNKTSMEVYKSFVAQKNLIFNLFGCKDADRVKVTEELVKLSMNNVESIKSRLVQRFAPALFLCTIFIVREGEDLSKQWTFEYAKEKIDDWLEENYKPVDFFSLALGSSKESQGIILENLETT